MFTYIKKKNPLKWIYLLVQFRIRLYVYLFLNSLYFVLENFI